MFWPAEWWRVGWHSAKQTLQSQVMWSCSCDAKLSVGGQDFWWLKYQGLPKPWWTKWVNNLSNSMKGTLIALTQDPIEIYHSDIYKYMNRIISQTHGPRIFFSEFQIYSCQHPEKDSTKTLEFHLASPEIPATKKVSLEGFFGSAADDLALLK